MSEEATASDVQEATPELTMVSVGQTEMDGSPETTQALLKAQALQVQEIATSVAALRVTVDALWSEGADVSDINMSYLSMVKFLLKWSLAVLTVLIIYGIIGAIVLFTLMILGLVGALLPTQTFVLY